MASSPLVCAGAAHRSLSEPSAVVASRRRGALEQRTCSSLLPVKKLRLVDVSLLAVVLPFCSWLVFSARMINVNYSTEHQVPAACWHRHTLHPIRYPIRYLLSGQQSFITS
jgi:hypothetical protein